VSASGNSGQAALNVLEEKLVINWPMNLDAFVPSDHVIVMKHLKKSNGPKSCGKADLLET